MEAHTGACVCATVCVRVGRGVCVCVEGGCELDVRPSGKPLPYVCVCVCACVCVCPSLVASDPVCVAECRL
jgi:hypothetical protein